MREWLLSWGRLGWVLERERDCDFCHHVSLNGARGPIGVSDVQPKGLWFYHYFEDIIPTVVLLQFCCFIIIIISDVPIPLIKFFIPNTDTRAPGVSWYLILIWYWHPHTKRQLSTSFCYTKFLQNTRSAIAACSNRICVHHPKYSSYQYVNQHNTSSIVLLL